MFADLGLGIFCVVLVSKIFAVELSWPLVIGGMLLALAPDLDFIFSLFFRARKKVMYEDAHEHRVLPHKPLIFILNFIHTR